MDLEQRVDEIERTVNEAVAEITNLKALVGGIDVREQAAVTKLLAENVAPRLAALEARVPPRPPPRPMPA
jgi:hypothetical protein